jgi:hypothetical protein
MISYLLLYVGLIVAVSIPGLLIVKILYPKCELPTLLASSYPMGSGLLTYSMFLSSWIGIRLAPWRIGLIYLAITVIILVIFVYRIGSHPGPDSPITKQESRVPGSLKAWLPVVVFLLLVISSAYLAVQRSYSTWDAAGIWGVKGLAIAMEGDIRAAGEWGSHGLQYPLNIPLQISMFEFFGQPSIEWSKLIFPVFYGSLILAIYGFLSLRAAWIKSFTGSLLVASVPFIFEHATIAYANLPFTTYIVLGCIFLLAPRRNDSRFGAIAGGIFFGLAAWSRPEGLFLVVSSLLVLGFSRRIFKMHQIITWNFILPFLFLSLPWQLFSFSMSSNSFSNEIAAQAMQGWRQLDFNLDAIYWTSRYALGSLADLKVWGGLGYVGLLLFLLNLRKVNKVEYEIAFNLTAITLGIGLSVVGYYYLSSYAGDVQYLLGTSVNRIFMPVWILGYISGFLFWLPKNKPQAIENADTIQQDP